MSTTITDLRRLPGRAWRILRWGRPVLSLQARLELIRLLFVDAIRGDRGK